MRVMTKTVDMSKVRTVVYHLPDGGTFAVQLDEMEHVVEFGLGNICDTSEIDGVVHFFPRGHA